MKVRLLTIMAGPDGTKQPGEVLAGSAQSLMPLVHCGAAVVVEADKAQETAELPVPDDAETAAPTTVKKATRRKRR